MRKCLIGLIFSVLIFGGVGCTSNEPLSTNSPSVMQDESVDHTDKATVSTLEINQNNFTGKYLLSAEDAIKQQNDDNVIWIDARGEDFTGKIVKNSVGITWKDLTKTSEGNPGDENWGTVLDDEDFFVKLGELGFDPQKTYIIYDQARDWGSDGYILWILRTAGYQNLYIVDGGIDSLIDAGAKMDDKHVKLDPITLSPHEKDMSRNVTTQELMDNYNDYIIIDSRSSKEYNGSTDYGEAKGGHLPNAIHIDFLEMFNENGTLKSNVEVEKLFTDNNITKNDPIVIYCTGGVRSGYMQLVLEMLGYDSYNYDDAYYRWSAINSVEK